MTEFTAASSAAEHDIAVGDPLGAARPVYDQYVSMWLTEEFKALLDGAVRVAARDSGVALKRSDVMRQLMERGLEATVEAMGPAGQAWYADCLAAGRGVGVTAPAGE